MDDQALEFEQRIIEKNFTAALTLASKTLFQSTENRDTVSQLYWKRQLKRALKLQDIYVTRRKKLKVKYTNFWSGFDPKKSELNAFVESCMNKINLGMTITETNPDIEITSCFGEREPGNYGQTRILYLGENVRPNFSNIDYSLTFDIHDYEGRNIYLPIWMLRGKELCDRWIGDVSYDKSMIEGNKRINDNGRMVYIGNNSTPMRRELIVKLRKRGYKIDEYGSHTNPVKDKNKTMANYTYSLCLENSFSPNYVTEKLIDGYISGTIPIYWGGIDVSHFNEKAFMNIRMNEKLDEFVERISEKEYSEYRTQSLFVNDSYMKLIDKTKGDMKRIIGNLFCH